MIIRGAGVTDGNPVIGIKNVVTTSNIASTDSIAELPVTNLANPSTHLYWGTDNITTNNLTVSGINETISYMAVANHNFGSAGFSCVVQTTLNGSTWTTQIPSTLITDDRPLIFQFAPITNCLGVRLQILGGGTQFGFAAVLYAGDIGTAERSLRIDMNHTPINYGTVSDIVNGMSDSGQFLGRLVRNQYQESKIDFWYFNNSFFRTQISLFMYQAVTTPFFLAWAPSIYPTDVGYCWLTKDPKPELHLPTDRWLVSFEMRGLA